MTSDGGFGFSGLFDTFDELEHRAEALYDLERIPEIADRSRSEYAAVSLASRLMASSGAEVRLEVAGVGQVAGRLRRVAADWCLVAGRAQDWIVRLEAISLVREASERSVPEVAWSPLARLGLGSVLRGVADVGLPCVLRLRDGAVHEVLLRRIGADFVEAEVGRGSVLVAFSAIAAVQSRPDRDDR